MTQIAAGSLEAPASTSTPNRLSAANADIVPHLEARGEGDPTQKASPALEVPRRARKLRAAATLVVLLAILVIGWGAGLKTREFVDVGQASAWFENAAVYFASNFNELRKQMTASIEHLASTSESHATIGPDKLPEKINISEAIERSANGLGTKLDLLRASSATLISELSRGFERLNGSLERSQRDQREIVAKLDNLQERLERVEKQTVGDSSRAQAQPPEKSAVAKPAPAPHEPSAPLTGAGGPKSSTAAIETRRIENWTVKDVADGVAILAGPRGIIEVSSGDVVPGVGRVQSISRRAGRWIVATNKGVISGR